MPDLTLADLKVTERRTLAMFRDHPLLEESLSKAEWVCSEYLASEGLVERLYDFHGSRIIRITGNGKALLDAG